MNTSIYFLNSKKKKKRKRNRTEKKRQRTGRKPMCKANDIFVNWPQLDFPPPPSFLPN